MKRLVLSLALLQAACFGPFAPSSGPEWTRPATIRINLLEQLGHAMTVVATVRVALDEAEAAVCEPTPGPACVGMIAEHDAEWVPLLDKARALIQEGEDAYHACLDTPSSCNAQEDLIASAFAAALRVALKAQRAGMDPGPSLSVVRGALR